jgi:hypothetical protein
MGTDTMSLKKILIYLEYILVGAFVYLLFSIWLPVLPALYYPSIHGQGAAAFIIVIFTLSVTLYVNSIAIRRLRAKER